MMCGAFQMLQKSEILHKRTIFAAGSPESLGEHDNRAIFIYRRRYIAEK